MTEAYAAAGRLGLSAADALSAGDPFSAGEAGLVDRLIDLLMALEPFEIKQHETGDPPGARLDCKAPTPTLSAESTQRMLAQMRTVLDREAARLGEDGLEGKAAVDQVALIARTLEKIDQMERLIAADQARSERQALSPQERDELRQTVRQLILAAAERLASEPTGAPDDPGEAGQAQQ